MSSSIANQTSVSPDWLPQVSAPFVYILKGLDDHNIPYENVSVPLSDLKPLQGVVDFDKVNSMINSIKSGTDSLKTIWTSQDNEILDGHHRYVAAMKMNPEGSISCMRILAPHKDAIRVLNKLGDLYDHDQLAGGLADNSSPNDFDQSQLNKGIEVEKEHTNDPNISQEIAMDHLKEIPDYYGRLDKMEKDAKPKGGAVSLVGYRQDPVKEKAVSGNFFHLQPKEGFKKYEIDFDNLLDTRTAGFSINQTNPIIEFCKQWCEIDDLDIIAGKHGVPIDKYAAKLIADKAKGMGFDGIKYGDIILQAF